MENPDASQKVELWTINADLAMAHLDSSVRGITETKARQRWKRHGPNRLREKPRAPSSFP